MSPLSLKTYNWLWVPKLTTCSLHLTQYRDYLFPMVFSSLSQWWFFICGGECHRLIILCTVQGYFWRTRQRSDAIHVMRPDCWVRSEVLSPTPHWDMRKQIHHIITTSSLGCRTAFLRRCLVLDRPNRTNGNLHGPLFLGQARLLSF